MNTNIKNESLDVLWTLEPGGDVAPILLTSPTAFRSYEDLFVVLN